MSNGSLHESFEWHHYLKRYRKQQSAFPRRQGWLDRSTLKIQSFEVQNLPEDTASAGVRCVYNYGSFLNKSIREDTSSLIVSEAILKTYPAKKLKREVFKTLEASLAPWQLECQLDVNGGKLNLLEFYYLEDAYDSDDLEKRTAGNVQITIPIKTASLESEEGKKTLAELEKSITRPFALFGYDLISLDYVDCSYDIIYEGKILGWVTLAVFCFESKYQDDRFEKNRFIYHITPASHTSKILKHGIVPKSSSKLFSSKDRIYLFNTFSLKDMIQYALESSKKNFDKNGNENAEWTVFQIDTKKIKNFKLYAVTNDAGFNRAHPRAVFTYQQIPPTAISKHKQLELILKIVSKYIYD